MKHLNPFQSLMTLCICASSLQAVAQCTATPDINSAANYSAVNSAYSIPCGSKTANLSGLTTANLPGGTTLTWHSATPATTGNKLPSVSAINGGTHKLYASFFDAGNSCYSPTKEITVYAPICATDDDYSATPVMQGVPTVLPTLFGNDTYNDSNFTAPNANINFLYELWNTSYATVNPDGTINVLPATPVGTYTFYYKIEDTDPEAVAGSNTSVAMVTIVVVAPLPVSMLYFNATKEGNAAQLSWATTSEIHNKGFAIERSVDSRSWNEIGFVAAQSPEMGDNGQLNYTFLDQKITEGNNFYRLKQVDADGTYIYGPVRCVRFERTQNISIYPNPAGSYVAINGLNGGEDIRLSDVSGKIVRLQKTATASATIPLAGLEVGTYLVHISDARGIIISEKIIKVK